MTEKASNHKNASDFWKKVLAEVEIDNNSMTYSTLVTNVYPLDMDETTLFLGCENKIVKGSIEKNENIIRNAIFKISGKVYRIEIEIKKGIKETKTEKTTDLGPLFEKDPKPEEKIREKQQRSGLNPKYTFENYIMGDNNQLAYAIATAVAQKPGEAYNPVFLYSGVGLGKTHLMQAIGNKIIDKKPGAKIIYTTGEQFTNELIDSIQSKGKGNYTSNQFRDKFRKADVLLIDDIQFIIGKGSTQEEFFHTFNALYMAEKQIIITSDRPPKEFDKLPDRIISRFKSGIIVDIQPPTVETRAAILRKKRDANKDPIQNEVIDLIAEAVNSNIRELEGAYTQLLTIAQANGKISLEEATKALGKEIKEKPTKAVNMNQILKAVCAYYSVKGTDLKGTRRTKELVIPRQVAMYLIKELTNTPFITIGDFLGGRDHTTVMHGTTKIEKEVKDMGKVVTDIAQVKQLIYEV